ncbi:hypothetical protein [Bradyrhizobium australiense]|uniref:Secreted protein n=1 Tax=Bradyrhizobium australiense TaxID=2721161 RepID=A0A7Y4LV56_9BRAD|nr:hypothetical protein [Bradyrhizobium australiense]NOJ39345.1 hypothetical protein [Bradyrhizobium australiense]
MLRLAQTVLALAAIFAAARCNLNAGDFISRGMEGSDESRNKSVGCRHRGMERRKPKRYRWIDKLTVLFGNNTSYRCIRVG